MKRNSLIKLSNLLFAVLFVTASCSKDIDKNPGLGGGDGGGPDNDISLTTPVAHSGDVPNNPDPDPVPKVLVEYAPFIGVWKQKYGDNSFTFLPDGRVAFEKLLNGQTMQYVGVYFKTNTEHWFNFVWQNEDQERLGIYADADEISVMGMDYARIGDAADADAEYGRIYTELKASSEANDAKFPVSHITNTTPDKYDPHPNNVLKGANVFITGLHFQASFISTNNWYDMPDGSVEGFDGYSRTDVWLMPNGRFFMQLWLWDGVNPRTREESFKHEFSWGKYTVIKGSDVMAGDVINFKYDNGATAAYRTVAGQACFRTKEVVYHQK